MRAAIFNPYLDTLGGGERYTLSFAKVLLDKGYQIDLEWKSPEIIKQLENRFGLNLDNINVVSDIKRGDGYDVCFWVSDGSIPALKARKNFLHFQVPFHDVNGKSLLNKMKLFRINKVICNSNFTKKIIDKEYGVESEVIYPPVDVVSMKPKRKENTILYVGRFSELLQTKHQDILVKNFKRLTAGDIKDWKLILAGGVGVGTGRYLESLKKLIGGTKVEIIQNPSFAELKNLYGKSKIFWSASGFGENENLNPEKVEHFGITIVEAMSAGTVPVAVSAGGHAEIIRNGENGFLWQDESDLLKITKQLIFDPKLLRKVAAYAVLSSKNFGLERFKSNVQKIL